jgi:aminoglycoside 6-adenylyltransferase
MITDGPLRRYLLRMLEWQARARRGADFDTWYGGRFMREWADAQLLAMLPETFATFEQADTYRALLASINLMDKLSRETAEKWQYLYPHATESRIREWVEALLPVQSDL